MSVELYWLLLTTLMTALFWLPYILDRILVRGLVAAVTDRHAETGAPHSEWAKRAIKAHSNAVENLIVFAPAVLAAHALSVSTETTQLAVVVYFFARLAHFVIYVFGVPLLRTLLFFAGWLAQIAIILTVLGAAA